MPCLPPIHRESKGRSFHREAPGMKNRSRGITSSHPYPTPYSVLRTCPPTHRVGSILVCPDFSLPGQHALADRMRQGHVCCPRVHVEKIRVLALLSLVVASVACLTACWPTDEWGTQPTLDPRRHPKHGDRQTPEKLRYSSPVGLC